MVLAGAQLTEYITYISMLLILHFNTVPYIYVIRPKSKSWTIFSQQWVDQVVKWMVLHYGLQSNHPI